MTTPSIVFGMIPIAFGRGDGVAGRAAMAAGVGNLLDFGYLGT